MNIAYARKLLSITEQDDLQSLKKKYHRLMSECHPDALGSEQPEHVRRAQEVNEAYQLLKKEISAKREYASNQTSHKMYGAAQGRGTARSTGTAQGRTTSGTGEKRKPEWTGEVNERAFRDRKIYLYYSMELETEEHPYYQAAQGKYLWNPKEEDFQLFLVSIHQLVKELLAEKEADLSTKSLLFHYLAEQFVEPVKVLHRIAKIDGKDKENREIYHFSAYLKMNKKKSLPEGMTLYPKAFQGNRIMVCNREGTDYGYLSFGDDRLYFCLIPLLKEKMAKVKMTIRNGKVDFCVRLEKDAENYRIPNHNLKIAELLGR